MDKIVYAYDIEVFPNFFSALFISADGSDKFVFYKYGDRDDIPAMVQFITQPDLLLIGYNSTGYDDIVMKVIMERYHSEYFDNENIFNVSKAIIETRNRNDLPDSLKEIMYSDTPWSSADMMALLKMNMNAPSLKHCAIHLEHPRLQDLPKLPTDLIQPDEVEKILDYNENDVEITLKLWHNPDIQDAISLRVALGEQYGVDLLSADDSRIGNVILEAEYGRPPKEFQASFREIIRGKALIPPTLEFKTEELLAVQKVIEALILVEVDTAKGDKTHLTYPKRKKFEHVFDFDGTTYKLAKGGLHSDDPPRVLRSTKEKKYRDCDVASYYPWLRQYYGLVPGHLDKGRFLEVDRQLIERRIEAKNSGDKVTADGLKITINGIFGKYNYQYFWLYDPLCFYRTTLYGQLLLLMLIEMLYLQGVHTVSANTDGIVCEIPPEKESIYYETCKLWEEKTGMSLDYTDYDFLVTLNVNSYMGVMEDGEIKTKKDFADGKKLKKQTFIRGYQYPIIALALQAYFKDGITPEKFIQGETNVHNFLRTQKTGRKFKLYLRYADGREEPLQKTNRYYVTNHGPVLVKKDKTDYNLGVVKGKSKVSRETALDKGHAVHILNDVTDDRPEVNRKYYIKKTREIIEKIEPPEMLTLFDFIDFPFE